MSLDPDSDIPYHRLSNNNPPKKPKFDLSLLANILIVILSAYLLTLKLFLFDNRISLDENLRIHISGGVSIHHSNLKEMIISITATARLWNEKHVSRETPLDLAFVIDFPGAREASKKKIIQMALEETLQFLGDQDRLSAMILNEESPSVLNYVPLANMTKRKKNTVFSKLGDEFSVIRRSNQTSQGLDTVVQFLNQRKMINSVTGIMAYTTRCDLQKMNQILQDLTPLHAFLFCISPKNYDPPSEMVEENPYPPPFDMNAGTFRNIFTEYLQNSLFGNVEFFVKPEQSELLQGVEIVREKFEEQPFSRYGMFASKNLSLIENQQKAFLVDVKIPNPTPPLPTARMDIKIADIQLVFTHVDGRKVFKNEDFMLNIWG